MKKLTFLLFFLPFVSFAVTSQSFSDVSIEREDFPYIENLLSIWAIDKWIVFRPDDKLTRAELVKIVVLASHWVAQDEIHKDYFPDVKSDSWYWPYVQSAKFFKIVDGYKDGTFKPNRFVTRAEAIKIAFNITWLTHKKGSEDYIDAVNNKWFRDYAYSAFYYWIYKWLQWPDWSLKMFFGAYHEVTRWEMATYVSRAIALNVYNYKK